MRILLDDIPFNNSLFPFGTLRSMVHIRVGILTIWEKWQMAFPGEVLLSSQVPDQNIEQLGLIEFPANIIPSSQFLKELSKGDGAIPSMEDCKILQYPWQLFGLNGWAIAEDFGMLTEGRHSQEAGSSNHLIKPEAIFVEEGAQLSHTILNATDGPIYIGKQAEIQEGSLIRGPFALGEGSRVKMGTRIYGATTIGPHCLAGGEIKNSIMMSYSNKGHDGYLGDSVIGNWCNLGAGTSNSNLKNTAAEVKMWNFSENEFMVAGTKCGLIMGDYSRCAINTSFNTGTIIGVCCNIFGSGYPPKYMGNFTWGNQKYHFDKAVRDINNWKKLKGCSITDEEIAALKSIY
ncbi:MAG: glucose-1-phosphate thymidylyltransferase [Bacteroidota bacterium]|nr:glucose-1-phosphate thymidylyltransferase [Bacteroidota bacterium]